MAILNASYMFKCLRFTEVWFLCSGKYYKLISVCYFVTVASVVNICMVSVLLTYLLHGAESFLRS